MTAPQLKKTRRSRPILVGPSNDTVSRTADLSACGRYRYSLTRSWSGPGPARHITFIGLNPSTADAQRDDPTLVRIMRFTRRLGGQTVTVVNLFALRATKPRVLATVADPVGPDNDRALLAACTGADLVIAAWGGHRMVRTRAHQVLALLDQTSPNDGSFPLSCLGRTADNQPHHPLRLPCIAPLEVFR